MKKEKPANKPIQENWVKTQPRSERQSAILLLEKCKKNEKLHEKDLVKVPIHNGYVQVLKWNLGCKCEGKLYVQDIKTSLFFCNKCGIPKPANSKNNHNHN